MSNFLIITCVHHFVENGKYFAYGPYVREMNLWIEKEGKVKVLAPLIENKSPDPIDIPYQHSQLTIENVPAFHIQSTAAKWKTIKDLPFIVRTIYQEMRNARHIHIRIPGNMGVLAMFIQILFPSKPKTIKYAGNWDVNSSQPATYKIQRFIANSTFLTKNAKVLVYGEWPDSSSNILPFFTASYKESEKEPVVKIPLSQKVKLVFVGAIYAGKNPEIGLRLSKILLDQHINFEFTYCGDGVLRSQLEQECRDLGLENHVKFLGNVNADQIKNILKESHFLIFVSETEGWPKAVAEAMFWGCVPFTSAVSCVPQMVGGIPARGVLVSKDPANIYEKLLPLIQDQKSYDEMSEAAINWSREFTLEKFQAEIEQLK